jgi:hypothetical protein
VDDWTDVGLFERIGQKLLAMSPRRRIVVMLTTLVLLTAVLAVPLTFALLAIGVPLVIAPLLAIMLALIALNVILLPLRVIAAIRERNRR